MSVGSVPESPGARRFAEESTTTAGGVEGREQLATMVGESVVMPGATAGAAGSLEAEAKVTDTTSEYGAEKLVVLEE